MNPNKEHDLLTRMDFYHHSFKKLLQQYNNQLAVCENLRSQNEALIIENTELRRRIGVASVQTLPATSGGSTISEFAAASAVAQPGVYLSHSSSSQNSLMQIPLTQQHAVLHKSRTTTAVTFSRCGNYLVSSGARSVELYWNRMLLATLESDSLIYSIRFSANGTDLVGACQGGIVMWDDFNGVNHRSIPGDAAFCVDVSPKDPIFATGLQNNIIRVWNQDSLKLANTLGECDGDRGAIHSLCFSPLSGAHIVAANTKATVWNVESRQWVVKFGDAVTCLGYSSDEFRLTTGNTRGVVSTWDTRVHNNPSADLNAHIGARVLGVTYSMCNRYILSVGTDGKLAFSDIRFGLNAVTVGVTPTSMVDVAHHPRALLFATSDSVGNTKIWSYGRPE